MPHGGNHSRGGGGGWGGRGRGGGWGGGWGRPIIGAPIIGGYVDPIQPVVYVNPLIPIFFVLFFVVLIIVAIVNAISKKEGYRCLCDRLGRKKCLCGVKKSNNKYIAKGVDEMIGWGV